MNEPKINHHYISNFLYPCGGVPENFRIDNLPVLVSGNILRDSKGSACATSARDVRFFPNNIFELKTIKINEK